MFTIRQQADKWELLDADGEIVASHDTYPLAVVDLAGRLAFALAEGDDTDEPDDEMPMGEAGLLAETWRADLCFAEDTGDGRDFSNVTWTARDPNTSTLPLMLQTETEMAHFGAKLAGFFTAIDTDTDAPTGEGRFYDTDEGRELRDMLLDGRRFGVSVDPGAVAAEFTCTEEDDDGFCVDGTVDFTEYEIIGVTATPFPAFAEAYIELDTTAAEGEQIEPVAASAGEHGPELVFTSGTDSTGFVWTVSASATPTRPPRWYFDDPRLAMPTPLTITDGGHVVGHVAAWGTCHVGSERLCIVPPNSRLSYARFYGRADDSAAPHGVECDDGTHVTTGALTWGIPHADLTMPMIRAQDHYANSDHGWADVVAGEDEHGIWIAGALRPHVTDDDIRVLRALSLSGDWRHDHETNGLEMIAALAVNTPGFPIPRAVVASGMAIVQPQVRAGIGAGLQQTALVASGIVIPARFANIGIRNAGLTRQPCDCDEPPAADRLDRIEASLALLERRTRHLTGPAIDHVAERFGNAAPPASYHPR
jgi:hypothetical protein